MTCNVQDLLTSAIRAGYMQLSTVQQQASITWLLCQNANGGGGGGAREVFCSDYSGGTPTDTPTGSCGIAFDTSTGTQWNYYGSAWH